jgi:hypothetical protein
MNIQLLPIAEYIQNCGIEIKTTSIAAALAVSRHLSLPSAEVESINMHFVSNVEATMNKYLSAINEDVVLDFDVATRVARSAYMHRYCVAYPSADGSAILPTCGTFFERVYSVGSYFDETTCAYAQIHADKIIALTNRFLTVLPSLVKE